MKNREGFTLIEMLVTIGLLAVIGVSIGITLNRNSAKQKETELQNYIKIVESSANMYASNNKSILSELNSNKGFVVITLQDLIDEGLINKNQIDPTTNRKVDPTTEVKISLDAKGSIIIEYPVEEVIEDYLLAKNIILEIGDSSIINYCYHGLNTPELGFMKKDGTILTSYLVAGNNIKCEEPIINSREIGTYELNYEYLTENNEWKSASRKVIIGDNTPPTKPSMVFVYGDWSVYSGGYTNKNLYAGFKNNDGTIGPSGSTDAGTGVAYYQISTDGSTWIKYEYDSTNSLYKMSTSGTHTRYFRACDEMNNCSEGLTVVGYIDKLAPTAPSMSFVYYNYVDYNTTWARMNVFATRHNDNGDDGPYGSTDTGGSGLKGYQISTDNEVWEDYAYDSTSSLYKMENGQHSRYFRACDNAGNCSSATKVDAKVDTEKPSLTMEASNPGTPSKIKTVTVKLKDEVSGLKSGGSIKYGWSTSRTTAPTYTTQTLTYTEGTNDELSFTITNSTLNGTYYLWIVPSVEDLAGNKPDQIISTESFVFDNTAPGISITATKKTAGTEVASNVWSDQGLNFKFTAVTGSSGGTIYYCKDTANTCTPGTTATSGTSITTYNTVTGTYYIRYKIVTGTGDSSSVFSYTAKVDTAKPVVSAIMYKCNINATNWVGDYIDSATYNDGDNVDYYNGAWVNYGVTYKYSATSTSGIASMRFVYNTQGSATDTGDSFTGEQTSRPTDVSERYEKYNAEGWRKGKLIVTNNAGTVTTIIFTVRVDKTAPTSPTMNFVYGDWTVYDGSWTNANLYAGRTSSSRGPTGSTDALSGVAKYQISTDDSNWEDFNYTTSSATYKMTDSGTHYRYFRACDNAGNCGSSTTVTGKIDKSNPTVKVTAYKYDANATNKVGANVKAQSSFTADGSYTVSTDWKNYGVTYKFESSALSGIKNIVWKWNTSGSATDTGSTYSGSGSPSEYTSSLETRYPSLTAQGYRKGQYVVTSNVGKSITVTVTNLVDTAAPTGTLTATASGSTITATISNVNDNLSGLASNGYHYIVPSTSSCENTASSFTSTSSSYSWSDKEDGTWYVCARLVDSAGNYASKALQASVTITTKYTITLSSGADTSVGDTEGTKTIYAKKGGGLYKNTGLTTKMTTSTNGIAVPTRDGYAFMGYYTKVNGGENKIIDENGFVTGDSITFTKTATIYAYWKPVCTPTHLENCQEADLCYPKPLKTAIYSRTSGNANSSPPTLSKGVLSENWSNIVKVYYVGPADSTYTTLYIVLKNFCTGLTSQYTSGPLTEAQAYSQLSGCTRSSTPPDIQSYGFELLSTATPIYKAYMNSGCIKNLTGTCNCNSGAPSNTSSSSGGSSVGCYQCALSGNNVLGYAVWYQWGAATGNGVECKRLTYNDPCT